MTDQVAYNNDMSEEVQEIIEVAPADGFGPPAPEELLQDPVETAHWILEMYGTGLEWLMPIIMMVSGYIILRHLIWDSLRFNYYHYLRYGHFVILWGDDDNNHKKKEQRLEISKELKIEADFASWCAALVMSMAIFALFALVGLLWPVTMIFVVPLGIVRLIGYRKRKKIEFKQKLKGEHLKT